MGQDNLLKQSNEFILLRKNFEQVASKLSMGLFVILLLLGILLICALVIGSVYNFWEKENYSKAVWITFCTLLFLLLIFFFIPQLYIQTWIDENFLIELSCSELPYILVIRSFNSLLDKDMVEETVYRREDGMDYQDKVQNNYGSEVIYDITNLKVPYYFIFMGRGISRGNHIFCPTSDEAWFEKFEELSQKSKAIFLIPGFTRGLNKEIQHVLRLHANKTIMFMPGSMNFSSFSDTKTSRQRTWNDLKKFFLDTYNLNLPEFNGGYEFWRLSDTQAEFLERANVEQTINSFNSSFGTTKRALNYMGMFPPKKMQAIANRKSRKRRYLLIFLIVEIIISFLGVVIFSSLLKVSDEGFTSFTKLVDKVFLAILAICALVLLLRTIIQAPVFVAIVAAILIFSYFLSC